MPLGIAKLISGELIIGHIVHDDRGDIIDIDKCIGLRVVPSNPANPQMIKIGFYPLNPFGPLPLIKGCFIIFSDDNIPEDIKAQYEQMSSGVIRPTQFQKEMMS
jgi:hypothetical protein